MRKNKGKSKGNSKGTKSANQGAEGVHKVKTSKAGLPGPENSKSDASSDIQESAPTYTTDISWNDVWNGAEWNDRWSFDEWNDDRVLLDGTKVGNKHMTLPQALIFTWWFGS